MWKKTYSKAFQGVKKEAIWKVLTDVNNWPKWYKNLDDCKIEGSFTVGNHFILKSKGAKSVKIVITDIKDGYEFTDCTSFFGAKMFDTHTISKTPKGIRLTNTLVVTGPLQWLWSKLVAQKVADTMPEKMKALVALVKEKGK